MRWFTAITLSMAALCLSACAGSRGVDKAFTNSKSAVQGNSHTFPAAPETTLRVVTGTLVQKGFAIEQVDSGMGLIKASRNLTDPKDPNTNYHISATAYVTAASGGAGSVVSLAASQQTVLYRKGHTWTMLPLIPIIQGAGGVITTWDNGRPHEGGRIIAAGDRRVHAEAMKLLSR